MVPLRFMSLQKRNHPEVVALLLKNKADPDLPWPGNAHATPLYIASYWNYPEVVALLLEYNADPDKPRSDGATPLDAASQQNHTEVILLLKAHRP